MGRAQRVELSDRAKQCLGRGGGPWHEMANLRCIHCGEAERTIRARDNRRCSAHRECCLRGDHTIHRRKPTPAHPDGKVIKAAGLTVPLPLVDTRPQEDRAAPVMPDGPALYIWDAPLAMHLREPSAPKYLCGEFWRTLDAPKRSAPLDKICGHCRIEASKMRGVIR